MVLFLSPSCLHGRKNGRRRPDLLCPDETEKTGGSLECHRGETAVTSDGAKQPCHLEEEEEEEGIVWRSNLLSLP